ncbi:MAG TPA: helix-turn-helix transcriptional regulator [Pyrinomonadaceae bacterium]|jgi:DNA-binding CsgD family transcriptional regulator|nr:helix-turn-helix transcriptional regulator [Pyrinomonadaceae bacterium]
MHTETDAVLGAAVARLAGRYSLSKREAEVALCCAAGLTNAAIALKLKVSAETIKFHLRNIYLKVGVDRRAQLIVLALIPDSEAGAMD